MLVKKDKGQMVESSIPGLADSAKLTIEEVLRALDELKQPDPWSRTPDHDGRRIEEVRPKAAWKVLNGELYRDRMGPDEKREYQRVWQANRRAEIKEKEAVVKPIRKRSKPLVGEKAYVEMEKRGEDVSMEPGNRIPLPAAAPVVAGFGTPSGSEDVLSELAEESAKAYSEAERMDAEAMENEREANEEEMRRLREEAG